MRLVHVITALPGGGAEHALCRLLENLESHAFHNHVIVLARPGELSDRAARTADSILHLDLNPRLPNPVALHRLRARLREIQPHVVHSWMYHANLAAALATRRASGALVWGIRQTLYDIGNEKRSTRAVIRFGARLSHRPQAIVYNSALSAAQHERVGFAPVRRQIVANGFDTHAFRPDVDRRCRMRAALGIAPGSFVVGHVARFHPMKGHANFLCAAALLAQSRKDVVIVLVGEGMGDDNRWLMERLAALGLGQRAVLCGHRHDMPDVNAAFDVACSSSAWGEAFPNALAEAMACGVPCVATDVGEARHIVASCGKIVPPRSPRQLADALAEIAGMAECARHALGAKARARVVNHYSMQANVDAYTRIYRQIGI